MVFWNCFLINNFIYLSEAFVIYLGGRKWDSFLFYCFVLHLFLLLFCWKSYNRGRSFFLLSKRNLIGNLNTDLKLNSKLKSLYRAWKASMFSLGKIVSNEALCLVSSWFMSPELILNESLLKQYLNRTE